MYFYSCYFFLDKTVTKKSRKNNATCPQKAYTRPPTFFLASALLGYLQNHYHLTYDDSYLLPATLMGLILL